jgi:hypothetical protein
MSGDENVADCEKLDQATKLLLASLKQSKALNNQIRDALQHREQTNAQEQSRQSADLSKLLDEITRILKWGAGPPPT